MEGPGEVLVIILGVVLLLVRIYLAARDWRKDEAEAERGWRRVLQKIGPVGSQLRKVQQQLAWKRAGETFDAFVDSLGPTSAARDIVRAAYCELGRLTVVEGSFPVHAEDSLSRVYGVYTPGGPDVDELVERIVAGGGRRITGGLGSQETPRTVKELVSVADALWQEVEDRKREALVAPLLRPADPPSDPQRLLRPVEGAPASPPDDLLRPVERPGGLDEATQRQTGT